MTTPNMYGGSYMILCRYEQIEESTDAKGVAPPEAWTPQQVEAWLVQLAASINSGKTPSPSTDLFEQGFDRYIHHTSDLLMTSADLVVVSVPRSYAIG